MPSLKGQSDQEQKEDLKDHDSSSGDSSIVINSIPPKKAPRFAPRCMNYWCQVSKMEMETHAKEKIIDAFSCRFVYSIILREKDTTGTVN